MAKLNVFTEVNEIAKINGNMGARVIALFAAFSTLAAIKAEFLKGAKDWPVNEKGEKVGEKAARSTASGKNWNVFTANAGRYVDVKKGRPLTEEEKTEKAAKAKAEKAKAAQAAKEEQEGIRKAAQAAIMTIENCLAMLNKAAQGNKAAQAALVTYTQEMEKAAQAAQAAKAAQGSKKAKAGAIQAIAAQIAPIV